MVKIQFTIIGRESNKFVTIFLDYF